MKFKRFTKPKFLQQVGRELLGKLFGRFSEDLAKKNVTGLHSCLSRFILACRFILALPSRRKWVKLEG